MTAKLDDFHLTAPEAHFLQGLPRKRRRAIMAAFRRKSFKERAAVVGKVKADFASEQAKRAEWARLNRGLTDATAAKTGTGET